MAWLAEEDAVTPEDAPDEVSVELVPESDDVEPVSEAVEPVSEELVPEFEESDPESVALDPVSDEVELLADEPLAEVEEFASEPEDFSAEELELAVDDVPAEADAFWLAALARSLVAEPLAGAIAWMNMANPNVEVVAAPKMTRRARERRLSASLRRFAPTCISSPWPACGSCIPGLMDLRLAHFI